MDGVEGEGGGVHRRGARLLMPVDDVWGQQPGRPGAGVGCCMDGEGDGGHTGRVPGS